VFRDRGIVEADLAGDLLRRRVAGHVVIAHLQGEFQEFLLPVGEGVNYRLLGPIPSQLFQPDVDLRGFEGGHPVADLVLGTGQRQRDSVPADVDVFCERIAVAVGGALVRQGGRRRLDEVDVSLLVRHPLPPHDRRRVVQTVRIPRFREA